MANGDPIPGYVFNDLIGWIPAFPIETQYADLSRRCAECGARIADHLVGGAYHPLPLRKALWFWQ